MHNMQLIRLHPSGNALRWDFHKRLRVTVDSEEDEDYQEEEEEEEQPMNGP